jgi:K+-sensing histidine kinase KdpD
MTIPTLLFLLFPTGRPPSRRWIPVAWFAAIYVSIVTLLSMLEETLSGYGLDNPIGIRGLGDVEEMGIVFVPLIPLILLCASSLVFRYRQAHSEERQQLKWVAVAAVVFAVGVIMGEMAERFELPEIAFPIFLGALPASIGVAMMKYRLYDIDVIINRTLVYGVLTAILGFVYVGLVLILQQVTASVTRVSDLAIAVSTLTVAGLFRPARSRVQALIDRHFYRRKYDAVKTVDEFSQRLRSEVELESLTRELLDVINRTMQPRYASVWLRTSSGTEAQHHGAGKSRA